jgi:UDP-N-acetylmuramyl pentapeptide phosphotransferase/UDP-N-acetylglucosamine-1-phosphate transferase
MTDDADAWHTVGSLGPAIWIAGLTASAVLIVLLRPLFGRFALAVPTARSSHRALTPQWGGLAVVAATVGVTALAVLASPQFGAETIERTGLVLLAALLLAVVGAVDDMHDLGAASKLMAQAVAVLLVIAALPADMRVLPGLPEWFERGLLLLGGIWFVNLVNFMDGIDWITVAEVVPITAGVALVGALGALPSEGLAVALALNGAMLGFAPFNRPVARLFLGDMGSLPIGLLVGWLLLLVAGSGHVAAALLLPLYFIADTTITLLRRLRARERVWEAHRSHFYQRAGDGGLSNMAIVARVLAVNVGLVVLAAMSIVFDSTAGSITAIVLGVALVTGLLVSFAQGRS